MDKSSISNSISNNLEGFIHFNKFFHFVRNLGSGTFGKVVLANDIKTGKEIAVKVNTSVPLDYQ